MKISDLCKEARSYLWDGDEPLTDNVCYTEAGVASIAVTDTESMDAFWKLLGDLRSFTIEEINSHNSTMAEMQNVQFMHLCFLELFYIDEETNESIASDET